MTQSRLSAFALCFAKTAVVSFQEKHLVVASLLILPFSKTEF